MCVGTHNLSKDTNFKNITATLAVMFADKRALKMDFTIIPPEIYREIVGYLPLEDLYTIKDTNMETKEIFRLISSKHWLKIQDFDIQQMEYPRYQRSSVR